eukprot:CAMPEP_0172492148 /NCGR_PEP_ID=MMETSP1066-20121228/23187_1 /TAXON_ID=671091 /ORGANISM="Coscinodiscus wailesii, Strain CCMP2513" /LENGTH=365 /DNA_ID=CAMNT_0013261605 /DNA_START=48 /DNA_END=1145 /DNA_ORIENTATION=+
MLASTIRRHTLARLSKVPRCQLRITNCVGVNIGCGLSEAPTSHTYRNITVGTDGSHFNTVLLMVPQSEEWMIERFGKFNRVAKPGLTIAVPFIDKIAYKRSLKETAIDIHPQQAITKDNVHVKLDGSVYTRVEDTYKASYGIDDPEYMISILAQSAMRKEVGNLELDELFENRETLNLGIATALDEASEPWGISVFRYEIANIIVDPSTKEAMERQSNAERLRRAEVLESQGYRERLINQSEGDRQSDINRAQGEAESMKLRAQAQADQIRLVAEAEAERTRMTALAAADGIRSIAEAVQGPGGKDAVSQRLAELYIGAIPEIAKNAKLVVVPDRPNDVGGVVATAMGISKMIDGSLDDGDKSNN